MYVVKIIYDRTTLKISTPDTDFTWIRIATTRSGRIRSISERIKQADVICIRFRCASGLCAGVMAILVHTHVKIPISTLLAESQCKDKQIQYGTNDEEEDSPEGETVCHHSAFGALNQIFRRKSLRQ